MTRRRAEPARAGSWREEAAERFVELRPAVLARMTANYPPELRADFEHVTGRQLQALSVLPEAGLTMRELASALGVTGATASVLSDRLVAQGLAVRGMDPADRRIVRLAATPSGAALAARYREAQRQAVAALLGSLTDEQVAAWLDIMQTLAGEGTGKKIGAGAGKGTKAPARPAELEGADR